MPTVAELRTRAAAARQRAIEARERINAADEPAEADVTIVDESIAEATRLFDQADAQERRDNMFADLERRGAPAPGFRNEPAGGGPPAAGSFSDGSAERADMLSRYSIRRALLMAAEIREGRRPTGVEAEIGAEVGVPAMGRRAGGPVVCIPWDAPVPRSLFPAGWQFRDVTTTTIASTVPTLVVPTLIELLRARLVLSDLGVRILPGITQPFNIPRQNASATGAWVGEQGSATKSNLTTNSVDFRPRTATANTVLSRASLLRSSIQAEALAIEDLLATIAQQIEVAGINGAGSSTVPLGIFQTSGVNSVAAGTNGGAPTWSLLNQMIGLVQASNAPAGSRAWLMHPLMVAKLAETPRIGTTFPKFIYDIDLPASPVCGYRVVDTSNVPTNFVKGSSSDCHGIAFGVWDEMMMALMSTLDVLADPFSMIESGDIRYAVFQDVDFNVRHPKSFSIFTDARLTA